MLRAARLITRQARLANVATSVRGALYQKNLTRFARIPACAFSTEENKKPEISGAEDIQRIIEGAKAKEAAEEAAKEAAKEAEKEPEVQPEPIGEVETHTFQAETAKLLDIVAKSLYTDREVFIRELISNASDALEKARHRFTAEGASDPENRDLQVSIRLNEKDSTFVIEDTGIGMTGEELMHNLGTIARSGSKAFIDQLKESGAEAANDNNIIGMFGVGFYSSLMVANKVTVYSQSADLTQPGHMWTTDGSGEYRIAQVEGLPRGTKIILHLNDESKDFSLKHVVKKVINKYSNFVAFPVLVDGERMNTIEPLWVKNPSEITEEQHKEFYKFIANAYDEPMFKFQFKADAPIDIKSLFYVPSSHMEKYGMGRMEPGVGIYSRKVLIQGKAKSFLPDWLRFVKGVVDSEDIPLNISREHMQDSALIRRLGQVVTRRLLKFFESEMKKDRAMWLAFWNEYSSFFKEGACMDATYKNDISKLLMFDSSKMNPKAEEITSLQEYVDRMPEDQKNIYYLVVPNRAFAESSPYFEAFKKKGVEVLFLYNTMDEFVMSQLHSFEGKELKTAESGDIEDLKEPITEQNKRRLDDVQASALGTFMQDSMPDRLKTVRTTDRLADSPAIVVEHDSSTVRRMMQYADQSKSHALPKMTLEINPTHPIIVDLYRLRNSEPELAKNIAEQVLDNALIAAGLMDDSRVMLNRLNALMTEVLSKTPGGEEITEEAEVISESKE